MKKESYNKWLVFSLDEKVKISDLKKNNFSLNYDFEKLEKWLNKNKISFMIDGDKNYHYKFSYIKHKPFVVYTKGNESLLNKKIVWIVGPRKTSVYWKQVTEEFLENLSKYENIVTVSGLAEWIDTLVFQKSIELWIPTIAVLGGGLWYFLQSAKREKIQQIENNDGLIISEFKLKQEPANYTFPQRNRIIAWLSNFVFLPEAGEKSWALITVDFANKMNIPVYGVANWIFEEKSKGLNKYIYQWKISMVYDIEIFLEDILGKPLKQISNIEKMDMQDEEKEIFDLINSHWVMSLQDISFYLGKDISFVMNIITILEMKWVIYEISPGNYSCKN